MTEPDFPTHRPAPPGDSPAEAPPPAPVLSYAPVERGPMVRIGSYFDGFLAEMHSERLANAGIICRLIVPEVRAKTAHSVEHVGDVELHVHDADAERARVILYCNGDNVEPCDEPADARPAVDEEGRPIKLVKAASYDNVRHLIHARTALASMNIRSVAPRLIKRGDRPPGEGKRFILRVREEDEERAVALLHELSDEENADNDPRCPKCHSWNVSPLPQMLKTFLSLWGVGSRPQKQLTCHACGHSGPPETFGGA